MDKRAFNILVILISAYLVFSNFNFTVGQILSYDIYGYYLYLPLTFIYGDLGIQNPDLIYELMEKYHSSNAFYQGNMAESGNYVLKYTMGQSILYAPFFFIGHLISFFTIYPSDGFSEPYVWSVFVGGIIYTIIGIYFFSKILLHFFSKQITFFVLFATVFGTNYLLHNTMYGQNLMTHNTLFTGYAVILWLTIKWHEEYNRRTIIYLALTCGLVILIRPTEIVCLLIPLFWNVWNRTSLKDKLRLYRKKSNQLLTFSVVVFCILSLQLIYFKIQTGSFFYSEYSGNAGEGLDLFPPHTLNTLFSFRKGWLIYTPIMIFALIGLRSLFKRNKAIFWSLFIYFIFNLWFVSSWSNWWYAASFSQRALIPSYVVLGVSLGYFLVYLNEKSKAIKISFGLVFLLFICLNLFQTKQYHHGVLHSDRMTMAYYFRTFGKFSSDLEDRNLLLFDRDKANANKVIDSNYFKKSSHTYGFESLKKDYSAFSHSGDKAQKLSMTNPHSEKLSKKYADLTLKDHIWVKVSAWVYVKEPNQQFYLMTFAEHNGKAYKYEDVDSKSIDVPLNTWTKISYTYLTPPMRRKHDEVQTQIWFREGTEILVDDLKMEVWEAKAKK